MHCICNLVYCMYILSYYIQHWVIRHTSFFYHIFLDRVACITRILGPCWIRKNKTTLWTKLRLQSNFSRFFHWPSSLAGFVLLFNVKTTRGTLKVKKHGTEYRFVFFKACGRKLKTLDSKHYLSNYISCQAVLKPLMWAYKLERFLKIVKFKKCFWTCLVTSSFWERLKWAFFWTVSTISDHMKWNGNMNFKIKLRFLEISDKSKFCLYLVGLLLHITIGWSYSTQPSDQV